MVTVVPVTTALSRLPATWLLTALLGAGLLTACSSDEDDRTVTDGATATADGYYLSIGDSYAAGYQPATDDGEARNTRDGFAWKVATESGLELVNHACSGISAHDFVTGEPCVAEARPPHAPPTVSGPELESVMAFLDDHGSEVRLVTIVLGGNDFQTCPQDDGWRACAEQGMTKVRTALDDLLAQVRQRIGDDVPVIGLTYPDVLLGEALKGPASDAKVDGSIELFRDIVNPALAEVYAEHDATFVDVTDEFDAYVPPTKTVDTEDFGTVPVRTATICELTHFCTLHDVHLTIEGHQRLADLVLAAKQAA